MTHHHFFSACFFFLLTGLLALGCSSTTEKLNVPETGPKERAEKTIVLPDNVLFESKNGQELNLFPGPYNVSQINNEAIRLTGKDNQTYDLRTVSDAHEETLDEAEVLSAEEDGRYHILWLQPNGTRMESVGFIGGVKPRATLQRQRVLPKRRVTQLRQLQIRRPLSSINVGCTIGNPQSTGSKIVYTHGIFGNAEIYVMNANGSSPTKLTSMVEMHPGTNNVAVRVGLPHMSPDGTKVAFVRLWSEFNPPIPYNEIYVMDINGTNLRRLSSDIRSKDKSPSWSPDGTKIAFTSFRDRNADGRENLEI